MQANMYEARTNRREKTKTKLFHKESWHLNKRFSFFLQRNDMKQTNLSSLEKYPHFLFSFLFLWSTVFVQTFLYKKKQKTF